MRQGGGGVEARRGGVEARRAREDRAGKIWPGKRKRGNGEEGERKEQM